LLTGIPCFSACIMMKFVRSVNEQALRRRLCPLRRRDVCIASATDPLPRSTRFSMVRSGFQHGRIRFAQGYSKVVQSGQRLRLHSAR
jgi:hypothetical protein